MNATPARVVYEFGEFLLDPAAHALYAKNDGTQIPTTPRVIDTLLYFIERRGELLDKSTLMAKIWPNVVVEENSLNQHISAIRRTLREGPGDPGYVVTVPGRGYRFVCEVRTRAPDANLSLDVATSLTRASIAVLPFASLSTDPEQQHFGDGMAEELIHLLSRVRGLKVAARTSSFAYKGRNLRVQEIAQALRVATVLEGSIRRAGNSIRVTAQMVDAASGYQLWSQAFDRELEDVFTLQDELARSIVHALTTHLGITLPELEAHAPPTRSLTAYQLYVQARALQARPSESNLLGAIALHREAIRLDRTFARAFSGAALAHVTLASMAYSFENALLEAERDARRALAIDPGLAEPQATLGATLTFRAKLVAADTHLRTALFLDPADPSLLALHCVLVTAAVGHMQAAHRQAAAAYELAPAYPLAIIALAFLSVQFGRDEEALRFADLAAALGFAGGALPIPFIRSQVAWRSGRHQDTVRHAAEVVATGPDTARVISLIESVFQGVAGAGSKEVAARELRSRTLNSADRLIDPMRHPRPLLLWATLLGDLDLAYDFAACVVDELARSGVMKTSAGFCNQFWLSEMRAFRQDRRFPQLAEKLGLTEYWEVHGPPDKTALEG